MEEQAEGIIHEVERLGGMTEAIISGECAGGNAIPFPSLQCNTPLLRGMRTRLPTASSACPMLPELLA